MDCATQPRFVGLALGWLDGEHVAIEDIRCGSRISSPAAVIAEWIGGTTKALIAIDAPLGWPKALGECLAHHAAGMALAAPADALFHRETDAEIERRLRKRPLEVGANLIARTAHAALALLADLRRALEEPIPLAWSPVDMARVSAIEVYPAATLRAHRIPPGQYKKRAQVTGRRGLLDRLGAHLILPQDRRVLETSPDAIDAVVCVVAGADFLRGRAVPPSDLATAQREGWIWAPHPASGG